MHESGYSIVGGLVMFVFHVKASNMLSAHSMHYIAEINFNGKKIIIDPVSND